MDKNAIKKYAVWARTELIDRVRQRAVRYEVTADANPGADSASGKVLTPIEKTQRQAAIARMRDKGYEYVIEEVAYTWFNRFAALRYMEVNNYLPSRVRVFTDENGSFKPQILTEAIHLNLDGLDMEKVYALKEAEDNDELYKYLLITQCNALSAVLPQMFKPVDEKCKQEKDDYTILLFPDNLLREGSVVEQMVSWISEDNWLDAVQIIGWLYQYYNSEPKDKVFTDLKKNIKITKENIPAATQLFTPDWIVRYMVENSLGRLWLEGHPQNAEALLPTEEEQAAYIAGDRNSEDSKWHYYLKEAEQESDVQAQLAEIRKEYATLKPEDILCIDPCMGSGHILVYMFDVLMKIYAAYGYSTRESVHSIIENNLYGLDIDDRAAQLAYFAVMMKAVQYDNRFLKHDPESIPQPHVYAIQESNHIHYEQEFGDLLLSKEHQETLKYLLDVFNDAKEYGSILQVEKRDYDGFLEAWKACAEASLENIVMIGWYTIANEHVQALARQAIAFSQQYNIVVTNPPYMGNGGMNSKTANFVAKYYPDGKADLFATFMHKCIEYLLPTGMTGMMTSYTWMFLSGYQALRENMVFNHSVQSLIQPEYHSFFDEAYVPICTFVIRKEHFDIDGTYIRLEDFSGAAQQPLKTLEAIYSNHCKYKYSFDTNQLHLIPGAPLVYWANNSLFEQYKTCPLIQNICPPKPGLSTGENDRFLRFWHEVDITKMSFEGLNDRKWYPINKGGEYRRWYGNHQYVVNWENDGYEIRNFKNASGKLKSRPQNLQYNFLPAISWSLITTGAFSVRYYPNYFMQNAAGICCYPDDNKRNYVLGFLNSKPAQTYASMLSPTINTNAGDIARIPFVYSKDSCAAISALVDECIKIATEDWDAYEFSWNLKYHPFVRMNTSYIEKAFAEWSAICEKRREKLMQNEVAINEAFIKIYGLNNSLSSNIDEGSLSVGLPNVERDIKSLISYAIGCMFGRYSLDEDGLVYAGGEWDESKYKTFAVDRDGIIPICDDEYFDDDITGLFVKFVETVYGKDTLNKNLKFIADALGGKVTPKEVIRNYFLTDFFADHCKMYQKRPIYWLFDSGKKNGFKALVYMHRYQPDTIARMRTDYVHEQQSRYRTAIADLENRIAGASTSERVRLTKQLSKLQDQSAEIHTYEEKIHHLADRMIAIDLDDGVKHNYEIFKDVLAKIK